MIPLMAPGEVGQMAAEAVRDLCQRAVAGSPIATYVVTQPMAWGVVADGGWDMIGAAEEHDGGGASLIDLVVVARAWGESCIPLPFLTTLMAKRWSAAARAHDGPVTLAVGNPSSIEAGRVPFGSFPEIALLMTLDSADLGSVPTGTDDDYAPSLLPREVSLLTDLPGEAATEMAVVWAAEATGCAEQVLRMSVAYAKERQQFERPIGSFQAVKHLLSNMKVQTEACETAVMWAALEPDDARRTADWALDTALTVIEKGIQVHGGMGFTWEMGLHYYLRHVLLLRELVRGLPG